MDSKKSKKAKKENTFLKPKKGAKKVAAKKHKPDWPMMLGDQIGDLAARVAALEELVRKQNPTNLPPEDPPP